MPLLCMQHAHSALTLIAFASDDLLCIAGDISRSGQVSADGHVLMVTGRIIWCAVCGRYQTSKLTCRLREQCPKQPENRSHYRLKRLQTGRHPATGEPLVDTARRLTLAGWSADVAISACKKGEEGKEASLTSGQPRIGEAAESTDG